MAISSHFLFAYSEFLPLSFAGSPILAGKENCLSKWLTDRLSPPKAREARWIELSTVLEHIWEEFFDPDMSRLERLRSPYSADDSDLIKKLREMGDYFSFDMPKLENRAISIAWRKLELEYKDMELIVISIFRRHYNNLPVHWLPLYAPLDAPYGSGFEIAPIFDAPAKNVPPEGMFLTSRGMLGADYGALMTMGLSKNDFLSRALPLIRRAKPLHIVFDGMLWFIRFDMAFEAVLTNGKSWQERDLTLLELPFSVVGARFDYTPADIRHLDCGAFHCEWALENSASFPFWPPSWPFWHLDKFLPEGFPSSWLPVDSLICGMEAEKNPLGQIYLAHSFINMLFQTPSLKVLHPQSPETENLSPQTILERLMSDNSPEIWQQARLLNRYYEKVGMAAAGSGCCPRFTEFAAGYGLVDDADPANPKLLPIPASLEELPGEFYRGGIETQFADGVTLCKCEIPQAAVGAPVRHNLIGIYDQDSELVAVCQTLPDWVTPSEIYRAFPAVTFPIEKEESNE